MGRKVFIFLIPIFLCQWSIMAQDTVSNSRLFTVSAIRISGNKLTRESVILRELPFKPGDSIVLDLLAVKKQRASQLLLNTTLFHTVDVTHSIRDSVVDMHIAVKERWYIEPGFHFNFADRNFNAWLRDPQLYRTVIGGGVTHHNFRGKNQRLGFDFTLGWRKSLLLSYKVPYFDRRQKVGFSSNLYYLNGHEVGFITRNNRLQYLRADDKRIIQKRGGDLTFTYRRKLVTRHSMRLGYEHYTIDDTIARHQNPEYLGGGRSRLRLPRVAYIFSVDHRDNITYPWSGSYFIGAFDQKGRPFGKSGINIQTLELNYRHYLAIVPKVSMGAGFRSVINRPDTLPYLLRSSLGYRYQVRGFEYYVLDGYNYFLITSELRYKAVDRKYFFKWIPLEAFRTIPLKIIVKVLYDQGYVSYPVAHADNKNNTLLNTWLHGWGVGLDFLSYYDKILRAEYSFNSLQQSGLFLHYIEAF